MGWDMEWGLAEETVSGKKNCFALTPEPVIISFAQKQQTSWESSWVLMRSSSSSPETSRWETAGKDVKRFLNSCNNPKTHLTFVCCCFEEKLSLSISRSSLSLPTNGMRGAQLSLSTKLTLLAFFRHFALIGVAALINGEAWHVEKTWSKISS